MTVHPTGTGDVFAGTCGRSLPGIPGGRALDSTGTDLRELRVQDGYQTLLRHAEETLSAAWAGEVYVDDPCSSRRVVQPG